MAPGISDLNAHRDRSTAAVLRDGEVPWTAVLSVTAPQRYARLRVADVLDVYLPRKEGRLSIPFVLDVGRLDADARMYELNDAQRQLVRDALVGSRGDA